MDGTDLWISFWTIASVTIIFILWWSCTDLRARMKERRESDKLNRELAELLWRNQDV